jgi:hypothetical protein
MGLMIMLLVIFTTIALDAILATDKKQENKEAPHGQAW